MKLFIFTVLALIPRIAFSQAPTEAEQAYAAGQEAYGRGDYATAIQRWQQSYQLSREPELLFDLGQAFRLSNDCTQALHAYRQFLTHDVASDRRAHADEFVHSLSGACPDAPASNTVRVVRGNRTEKLAGLATSGAGLLLLATGTYFGHESVLLGKQATAACFPSCDWAAEQDVEARGRRDETLEWVFLGAGVSAILVGGWLYYEGIEAHHEVAVTPLKDGAAVSLRTSW